MEVLFALITIAIFIVRAVKQAQEKAEEQNKQFEPPVVQRPQQAQKPKPKPAVNQTMQRKTRSMEHAEGESTRTSFVSSEGFASQEGQCIEPNPNHCAVEHEEDSVYASEIKDEAPVVFNRENLVQGIVMAEILKPKWSE